MTVTRDLFASAVGTMNSDGDHGIFCLSKDFRLPLLYHTIPFSTTTQALHLLEEVVPTPFRMGKYEDKKPLPLSFKWIPARPGPIQHARRQFASEMPFRYRSRHPLLGKKRSLLTALNAKMQDGCDWGTLHERRSIDRTTPQCLLHLL